MGGLIEKDERWIADQGHREVEPPLLTAGEFSRPLIGAVGQADEIERFCWISRVAVVRGLHPDRFSRGEFRNGLGFL